jgi:hypothetical protein
MVRKSFHGKAMNMTKLKYRMFSLGAMAIALFVLSAPAFAAQEVEKETHDGKVVSIIGDKLVMTSSAGQEHSHTLTSEAKLTLDGKPCKAEDLKSGTRIRVTTGAADKGNANSIEGLDKNGDFASDRNLYLASYPRDGRFVRLTGNRLVMTGTQSQADQSFTLTADVKVTCDGNVCQPSDLKPGMRIRVISANDDPEAIAQIEALDKNLDFGGI